MIRDKNTREIIKKLSIKYKLDEEVIEAILESQFKVIRDSLQQGDKEDNSTFLNARMIGLGSFIAKKQTLKPIYKNKY